MILQVPENPTGPLSSSIDKLCVMVARSAAFRRLRDVANEADARRYVKAFSFEKDASEVKLQRPFAVVWPTGLNWGKFAGGSKSWLHCSGELQLILTAADPGRASLAETESDYAFAAWVDEVLLDLAGQAGCDDGLPIDAMQGSPPLVKRNASQDEPGGAYLWAQIAITWSNGGSQA